MKMVMSKSEKFTMPQMLADFMLDEIDVIVSRQQVSAAAEARHPISITRCLSGRGRSEG